MCKSEVYWGNNLKTASGEWKGGSGGEAPGKFFASHALEAVGKRWRQILSTYADLIFTWEGCQIIIWWCATPLLCQRYTNTLNNSSIVGDRCPETWGIFRTSRIFLSHAGHIPAYLHGIQPGQGTADILKTVHTSFVGISFVRILRLRM